MMLLAVGPRDEVLSAVFYVAEWTLEGQCEPGDANFLRLQHAFVAEAAADIGRDDADASFLDPDALGQSDTDNVRHLCRGVNHELVGLKNPIGDNRLAFERYHRLPRHRYLALDSD